MCLCPFLPSPTSGHLSCYKPLSGLGAWLRFSLNTSFFPTLYLAPLLAAGAAKSLQSCPTLCDLIDGSPPGSPVPGILQARTLEWVAISFSLHSCLTLCYLVSVVFCKGYISFTYSLCLLANSCSPLKITLKDFQAPVSEIALFHYTSSRQPQLIPEPL